MNDLDSTTDVLYTEKFRPNYDSGNYDKCFEILINNSELLDKLNNGERKELLKYSIPEMVKLHGENYGRVK